MKDLYFFQRHLKHCQELLWSKNDAQKVITNKLPGAVGNLGLKNVVRTNRYYEK